MSEGQTYPAVGVPFAMTQWTPQTRAGETKCVAPYYYTDSRIQGIRASHFLSGSCVPDYGTITLMPGTGALKTDAVQRASSFDRSSEQASPYAYSVDLKDTKITASVTGTTRAGILRFEFQQDQPDAWVVLENNARAGEGFVQVDAARQEVTAQVPVRREYAGSGKEAGYSAWFVAQFDRLPNAVGTYVGASTKDGATRQEGDGMPAKVIPVAKMMTSTGGASAAAASIPTSATRPGFGTYLHFGAVHRGDVITVRVGSSFVSLEEARKNLIVEIPDWDYERVKHSARSAWHRRLSAIQVDGNDPARSIFYTALYHAMLQPRTYSDVSGTYPRFHDHGTAEHVASGDTQFDDFSVWDIFRAQAPLMMILDPKLEASMMQSIITKGEQGGYLPIFPAWNSYTSEMVGDHAASMIADAYNKGIRGFDIQSAYKLIRKNATEVPSDRAEYIDGKGRRGLDSYLKYGYIPLEDHMTDAFHKDEQVSRTLEYAYDDAIAGDLAAKLGHADDAAMLHKRGENWRKVYDAQVGFARGRNQNGSWVTPFDPTKHVSWVTEGTPWQYTFFVPQNVPGLMEAMGGKEKFTARLDEFFSKGYDDHGNEPGHHIAYLYAAAGHPEKTQKEVRNILDRQYKDGADGLAGNDDAGQMSAWYVMSALGFYQVCPGRPVYTLASPRFDSITVMLPAGRKLRILAPGAESGKFYASRVTWNGKPITDAQLQHKNLMQGGTLRFTMSDAAPASH
ncbi:alpha-1,2-mannosidase, putative [Terriglobus roseus]|uniref:Alpha-1,2-mannosidase, putative n=2 Tax=Terriglobus roseus TaxID=392734 RepID=A0A1H4L0A4_9BACT|nr:alpha-1,2-mannosidase, putative [Terriglobus roseus]